MIGLFTFYTGNYGACLQAFALQRFIIDALGKECLIVRTRPGVRVETSMQKLLRGGYRWENIRRIFRGRKKTEPIDPKLLACIAKRKEVFAKFEQTRLLLDDNPNRLFSDYYKNPPDYDIYLSGSDQVWNPISCGRCNPVYYLDIAPAGRRRVSYGSSFAVSKPPVWSVREMKRFLRRMDEISVRETQGAEIVQNLTGRVPPVVLDPTFLLDAEMWKSFPSQAAPENPYILIYRLGTMPYFDEFKAYVQERTGMRTLSLPFGTAEMNDTSEKVCDADPIDFVHLIAGASLVVTDSFHGAALSCNLRVPFWVLQRESERNENNMNSRIFSILRLLNLEDRLIKEGGTFPADLTAKPDFDQVHQRLQPLRTRSIEYLERVLS